MCMRGGLTATPDPRPSHLYIPSSRQADPRTKPRTKPPIFPTSRDWRVTSKSQPQTNPLSQPTRGIGDLEGVPDTRSGGSVLKAPQRRRGGTPPQALSGTTSQTTNPRKPHSPASMNRYNLSNPNPQSLNPRKRRPVRHLLATPIGSPAPWRIRARYLRGRRSEPALHR